MTTLLGLDFGTSNTALATLDDGVPRRIALEGEATTLPSALFYGAHDGTRAFGREAFECYLEGDEGRLLRGIKTVLGTSLMHERTAAGGRLVSFADVIAALFERVFEAMPDGRDAATLVVGRPVRFGDPDVPERDDPEAFLREVLHGLGFREVHFLYEPLAAALAYERTATREELALVVDIGGGTSDFSVVRISPSRRGLSARDGDVLANTGVRIGGDRFDERFSLAAAMPELGYGSLQKGTERVQPGRIWFDLATWHRINALYDRKTADEIRRMVLDAAEPVRVGRLQSAVAARRGHAIADAVERTKAALSDAGAARLELDTGSGRLALDVSRAMLEGALAAEIDRIRECALDAVRDAGVAPGDVDALFYTGGSSLVPLLRRTVGAPFVNARAVHENAFGSVAEGLAIEAGRRASR